MALKDWKKIRGMDRWESDDDQIDVGERRVGKWTVVSIYGKFKDKPVKNRMRGIAFAKSYMRKH